MGPIERSRTLLAELGRDSRFSREDFEVQPGETKLGDGLECVVLQGESTMPLGEAPADPLKAGIRSSVDGPNNPGFDFRATGSKLRPGTRLEAGVHYTQMQFQGQRLNPLAGVVPSSAALPVKTVIDLPPIDALIPILMDLVV